MTLVEWLLNVARAVNVALRWRRGTPVTVTCGIARAGARGLAASVTGGGAGVPSLLSAPTVSGTAQVGQTLTATSGSWTNVPTAYAYQWQRSANGSTGWGDISGATAQSYTLASADLASYVRVRVTASNAYGASTPATSAAAGAVIAAFAAPANTSVPVVSGVTQVGQTLSATSGTWSGSPTPTYAYQWVRDAADIAGASASTYTLVSADNGATIRVRVTATNSQGSASAQSATVGPVTTAGVPVQLTTLTVSNTSASQQSANFITPFFGHGFKKGDVPTGTYPRFELTDGTVLAYTMWNRSSWADGSLKFAGFMLRVPTTVAGSGTLTINVKNNGAAPGTSARSTADLTSLNLSVDLVGTANLSGTWTSSLSQGVADNDGVELLGDGGAGKIWRIRQQFMQSGANHGQLECFWYVAALQDASGGLAGVRVLGRITQPWLDVDSPAKTHDRSMTASLKSGSTTIRSLNGGTAFRLPHFCSVFTCDVDGRYDFRPGTIAAESTVRVLPDRVYLRSTRLIPPYDFTISPPAESTTSYAPMSRGPLESFQDGTGYHANIGPMPESAARYFIGQAASSERSIRVHALSYGAANLNVRRASTGQPVVLNNTAYSGMGAAAPTMRWRGGSASGFTAPSGSWLASTWDSQQGSWNTSHWQAVFYAPLIATGEPQYLDMQLESANNAIIARDPGGERNHLISGTQYYAICQLDPYQLRTDAWGLKEIFYAAGVIPDGHTARQYFVDLAARQFDFNAAFNAAMGTNWQNYGGTWVANAELTGRPWQTAFFLMAACQGYAVTEDPDALVMLNHVLKWYDNLRTSAALDMSTAPADIVFTAGSFNSTTLVKQISDYYSQCSFGVSGGSFVRNGYVPSIDGLGPVTMQTGDAVMFAGSAPSGYSTYTRYYMRDVDNATRTFKLSSAPGGAAMSVPGSGSWSGGIRITSAQTGYGMEYNYEGSHAATVYSAMRWAEALGGANAAACRPAFDTMRAAGSWNLTSNPKSALAASFT